MSKEKRQRSENWLEEDKIMLQDLVRERVLVLENKNTDANTNKKKIEAWNDLVTRFNGICVGATRTLSQVKAQWSLIKRAAKKKNYENKKNLIKTGGGAAPPTISPSGDDIEVWLANEFITDTNCYDSDTIDVMQQGADLAKIEDAPDIIEPVEDDGLNDENIAKPGPSREEILWKRPKIHVKQQGADLAKIEVAPDIVEPVEVDGLNDENNAKPGLSREEIKRKRPKKQETNAAILITENEVKCRREMHMMQMELAQQQLANEEHYTLHLEEKLLSSKLTYYNNKNKQFE